MKKRISSMIASAMLALLLQACCKSGRADETKEINEVFVTNTSGKDVVISLKATNATGNNNDVWLVPTGTLYKFLKKYSTVKEFGISALHYDNMFVFIPQDTSLLYYNLNTQGYNGSSIVSFEQGATDKEGDIKIKHVLYTIQITPSWLSSFSKDSSLPSRYPIYFNP